MKRLTSLLMLALAAAGFVGCAPDTPEKLSTKAEEAYASGAYSEAITAYERLLATAGEDAMTYANLAQCALAAQDLDYAQECAAKALQLGQSGATAERTRELLGMVAEARQDLPAAIRHYRSVLNAEDGQVRSRTRSRLAKLYSKQNRSDSALAMLLLAYNDMPQDALTLYNLGTLCVNEPLRLRRAALDYFRMAERALPAGSTERTKAKAWVARLESNLNRLRQLPPSTGDAKRSAEYLRKAADQKARKRWRSAEDFARQATQADPANFEAALELGRICAQNNHRDEALKAYDAAVVLRPTSAEARYEAAWLAYTAKRYNDAAAYLRPLLIAQPKNARASDLMMRILYDQQKGADARVWGEYYLSLTPNAAAQYRAFVSNLPQE